VVSDRLCCAVICGLTLAALLCLFLGDHMFTLAFGVGR